jgi:hypothetical protein
MLPIFKTGASDISDTELSVGGIESIVAVEASVVATAA